MSPSLELFPIGNCAASALIDEEGRFVWACAPRVDGDPFFSALLSGGDLEDDNAQGLWSIEVVDRVSVQQAYVRNTPILRTEITDARGGRVEILDFCPRYRQFGRLYRPLAFVRLVRPRAGTPRIRIKLRPTVDYGSGPAGTTNGSNHVRYVGGDTTLRLTTDGALSHILDERTFRLEEPLTLFLGPDEGFESDITSTTRRMLRETTDYWRHWVRTLSVPLEWQAAVIRSAITLKLCQHEDTGAIVAALTTSIPEHGSSPARSPATGTTASAGCATPTTWCRR